MSLNYVRFAVVSSGMKKIMPTLIWHIYSVECGWDVTEDNVKQGRKRQKVMKYVWRILRNVPKWTSLLLMVIFLRQIKIFISFSTLTFPHIIPSLIELFSVYSERVWWWWYLLMSMQIVGEGFLRWYYKKVFRGCEHVDNSAGPIIAIFSVMG
jgi:hypothetical protein